MITQHQRDNCDKNARTIVEDDDPKWKYCNKSFKNKSQLWKHYHQRKTACVSVDKLEQIYRKAETNENKVHYFQKKTQKQQEEIDFLKKLLNQNKSKDIEYCKSLQTIEKSLTKVDQKLKTQLEQTNKLQSVANHNQINQTIGIAYKDLLKFGLVKMGEERLDHLTKDTVLNILNVDNFSDALKNLTEAIYFHPKAPENMIWCIHDNHAFLGAIEYNFDQNVLLYEKADDVIEKHMGNIMFRVSDLLHELKLTSSMNKNQWKNQNLMFSLVGCHLTPQNIKDIKECAYQKRFLPKAIWSHLHIKAVAGDKTFRIITNDNELMLMSGNVY